MRNGKNMLEVDGLCCQLRRSEQRSTVGITVEPDGEVVVAVPADCPLGDVRKVVRGRLSWIYRKRTEQRAHDAVPSRREYLPGEGFYFLGKHYRLKWTENIPGGTPVERRGRWLCVQRDQKEEAETHIRDWYKAQAKPWLIERVRRYAERIGVEPSGVTVQDLGTHWGSCGKNQRVYFHWRTIQLPPHITEYVVAHELVHLVEPDHSPAFWKRIKRCMPDYIRRKRWLSEHGAQFS